MGALVADGGEKILGVRVLGRRPTIHDVARSAAVSPATVSNVLTGRRHVDPDLANRVRLIVDELGYQRDVAASALRSAQRTVVGAVVPELGNPFFAEMVDRLEREARLAGRRLLVATSGGDPAEETRQVEALIAWRPAGMIAVPCDGTFAARAALEREGIPFVVLDRPLDDGGRSTTVAVDNVAAACEGAAATAGMRPPPAAGGGLGDHDRQHPRARGRDRHGIADVPGARAELIEAGFEVDAIAAGGNGPVSARKPLPTAIFTLEQRPHPGHAEGCRRCRPRDPGRRLVAGLRRLRLDGGVPAAT